MEKRKIISSVKGLFGQIIHYDERGNYASESWPGMFDGSMNHYDADGNYCGSSDQGIIVDRVHYDADGNLLGTSSTGIWGQKIHNSAEGYYSGESWENEGNITTYTSDGE